MSCPTSHRAHLRNRLSSRTRIAVLHVAVIASLALPMPAHAVRLALFGLACADSDTSVSYIELSGLPDEPLSPSTGLRVLDRNGQTLENLPNVYFVLSNLSWFEGNRHFIIATQGTATRFRYPGEPARDFPNNVLPAALDAVAGSLIIYRLNGTTETTLDRVDYGQGQVPAPPPGTAMERSGTGWRFQPAPSLHNFFSQLNSQGRTDDCFNFQRFDLSEMSLACEDGDARGQYLELALSGPNLRLDARLHVRMFDHTGALLADVADVFGARQGEPVETGTTWLLGGPAFAPSDTALADATLPVSLDPAGGRIELSGNFYGTTVVFDSFAYGVPGTPVPAAGTAYTRTPGGTVRVMAPQPHNSLGLAVTVPLCALGSNPAALRIGELALACASGAPDGQFVKLRASGSGVALDPNDRLRAYGRDGALRYEERSVYGRLAGTILTARDSYLLVAPDYPFEISPDAVLSDTLDRVAGRLELVRATATGDSLLASLAWGDAPLLRPAPGSSLVHDLAGTRPTTYPTPTNFARRSLTLPACHLQRGPRTLEIEQLALACVDQSNDGLFLELGALDPVLVSDPTLGLRLLAENGSELSRVLPLFPTRDAWPVLAGRHWLVAGPAFAVRAADAPDAMLSSAPGALPASVVLFRHDPVTAAETTLASVTIPGTLLDPGHAALRLPNGQYERAARPLPHRLDGTLVQPAACWLQPHPEQAAIHSLFLRCRDGDLAGQYVELEATSPETDFAPELLLRVFDRSGQLTGQLPAPYPADRTGRAWPPDTHVLLGATGFAARTGVAPDATLPAVLDTVAGRVELLLAAPGGGTALLDKLDYGTPATPAPGAGASLERSPQGLVRNVLPSPAGVSAQLAAPTACLGECPARTVQFALGGLQALSGDTASVRATGTQFDYSTAQGTFRLDSHFRELTVHWSDRFRLEGLPAGSPLAFEAHVRTILASADSCFGNRCFKSLASVTLTSATDTDSVAAKPDPRRTLVVPVHVNADESFSLELSLRANAVPAPALAALVVARLEFAGLPLGARVVSCHGFDTRAQRGMREPEVLAEPRQVTVRWPVDGPTGFIVLVERSVDDGAWQPLETRGTDADGMLRVVDHTVSPGHRYRYRTGWSDEFASYTSPEAEAAPPPQPGFDFARVRPNPSHGELAVTLELPEASDVRLEVLDVAGRVLVSSRRALAAGSNVVPLTRGLSLAPGLYIVRLHYRDLVLRQTVVVLR